MLSGCGISNGNGREKFIDQNSDNDIARAMLSDGVVTESETKQAIENIVQCYEKQMLTGEYAVNLDVYPWMFGGSVGLSSSHPEYRRMPETMDDEARELAVQQGKVLDAAQSTCDSQYQEVYDWVFAHADLDEYALKRYDDTVLCAANAAPSYYRKIDPRWREREDRQLLLSQITLDSTSVQGQEEYDAYVECQVHGTTPLIQFGVP